MRDDEPYLQFILRSINLVKNYVAGSDGSPDRRRFDEDIQVQDATLRRLEILADAASQLSDDLRNRHPDIPWRQIADFRNVLAHAYVDVRLDQVWNVIDIDLPPLEAVVESELRRMSRDDELT